jgi:non-specific protein-tyrosine kinase
MELRQYALMVWRWLWLIVLAAVLAAGAAFIVARMTTPVYSATITLLVSQAPTNTSADYTSVLTSERLARTYSELLRTPSVLDSVIQKLSLPMRTGQLAGRVQVQLVRDTQLIKVSVEDTDPAMAAQIANTIGVVFKSLNEERQLERYASVKDSLNQQIQQINRDISSTQAEIDALKAPRSPADEAKVSQLQIVLAQYRNNLAVLLNNLAQVRMAEAQGINNVVVAQEATVPLGPIRPRTLTNTMLAGIVGALLAMGVAFLIEYLDDTIKTPDDVEQIAQTPTLGMIARIEGAEPTQKLVTANTPRSPISEAFRVLRTNIQFGSVDKPLRSLVVTSSNPSEGKSTTAANLAVVLAQAGRRVVAVDADLRRPTLHKYFGVSNNRGLTTALLDGAQPMETHLQSTNIANLRVMSSGPLPPNPAELLGSQRMGQVIELLNGQADVLVFDSPPILAVTDAVLLSRQVDGTVLVVDVGNTRRAFLARAIDALKSANSHLLGVAFNRISNSRAGYYSYAYQYAYYYGGDGQRKRRERLPRPRWPWQRALPPAGPAEAKPRASE